jgi:hypothetical protein
MDDGARGKPHLTRTPAGVDPRNPRAPCPGKPSSGRPARNGGTPLHDQDDDTEAPAVCRIGNHPHRGEGRVCERHLDAMRDQLAGIARMTRLLPSLLVPGSAAAGPGAKVSTSRTGSPTSARLDVLSLLGPGGAEIRRDARMLSPLVRRWATQHTYQVTVPTPDGKTATETRTLYQWHAEVVTDGPRRHVECSCNRQHVDRDGKTVTVARPLMVLEDDQVGSIPPAEWLDMWVRRWRIALGYTTSPIRGRVSLAVDTDQRKRVDRAKIAQRLRSARTSPALMPAVAQLIAIQRAYEKHLQRAKFAVRMGLMGIRYDGPEHQARVAAVLSAGKLPAAGDLAGATFTPVHDPIAAEWATRAGYAGVAAAVEVDAGKLAEWLPLAADTDHEDVDLSAFATELRGLHRELEHVLGETSDDQWIGKCPAKLRDAEGEETDQLCGAGLWQDPYRSRVECPRCHTVWPSDQWMHLASLIRVTWPIDRRRRYYQGDKVAAEKAVRDRAASGARSYRCRGCERVQDVEWSETTRRGEVTRTWSPVRLVCPSGCLSGGTTAATAAA